MDWNWEKYSTFTYTKEQIVKLASWYRANKEFGHEFSTAILYSIAPADTDEPAIWPDAVPENIPNIVHWLEQIRRVDNGERKVIWTPLTREHHNSPTYINYTVENWIREGLQLPQDLELELPEKFKPDFTVDLSKNETPEES